MVYLKPSYGTLQPGLYAYVYPSITLFKGSNGASTIESGAIGSKNVMEIPYVRIETSGDPNVLLDFLMPKKINVFIW